MRKATARGFGAGSPGGSHLPPGRRRPAGADRLPRRWGRVGLAMVPDQGRGPTPGAPTPTPQRGGLISVETPRNGKTRARRSTQIIQPERAPASKCVYYRRASARESRELDSTKRVLCAQEPDEKSQGAKVGANHCPSRPPLRSPRNAVYLSGPYPTRVRAVTDGRVLMDNGARTRSLSMGDLSKGSAGRAYRAISLPACRRPPGPRSLSWRPIRPYVVLSCTSAPLERSAGVVSKTPSTRGRADGQAAKAARIKAGPARSTGLPISETQGGRRYVTAFVLGRRTLISIHRWARSSSKRGPVQLRRIPAPARETPAILRSSGAPSASRRAETDIPSKEARLGGGPPLALLRSSFLSWRLFAQCANGFCILTRRPRKGGPAERGPMQRAPRLMKQKRQVRKSSTPRCGGPMSRWPSRYTAVNKATDKARLPAQQERSSSRRRQLQGIRAHQQLFGKGRNHGCPSTAEAGAERAQPRRTLKKKEDLREEFGEENGQQATKGRYPWPGQQKEIRRHKIAKRSIRARRRISPKAGWKWFGG